MGCRSWTEGVVGCDSLAFFVRSVVAMLNLYGPAFGVETDGCNVTDAPTGRQTMSDRKSPSTADQILFLLDSVSCFKALRDEASCRAARSRVL